MNAVAPRSSKTRSPVPRLIARKRDGEELSAEEIHGLLAGYTRGEVPDYQMAAFAMAVYFRGMSPTETAAMTLAMRDSGRVLDLSDIEGAKVDKHSTGGVGDKVSLCLTPLVVACGLRVPMISGRGLGHTGGTLDKLEAIPGFRTDLTPRRFVSLVRRVGCALGGQTERLAPADRRLYALRDVTATVESIPLITASILSKKLAEGIEGLVLDVKVGRGAFMKDLASARKLARSIVQTGAEAGLPVTALLTDMDVPLGRAVGNAPETAEAFALLQGEGPEDLYEVTMALATEMLLLGGLAGRRTEARSTLRKALRSGEALRTMERIVAAQGGDPRCVTEPDRLPRARVVRAVRAPRSGYVQDIDALAVGLASGLLGAGRQRVEDAVDPAAGIVLARKPGERIERNEPLAWLHTSSPARARAVSGQVLEAFRIGRARPAERKLLLGRIASTTR